MDLYCSLSFGYFSFILCNLYSGSFLVIDLMKDYGLTKSISECYEYIGSSFSSDENQIMWVVGVVHLDHVYVY